MQVATAGIVERAHGLLISHSQIVEDGVAVRIGRFRHRAGFEPEMHHARRRDRHLRRDLGMRLQELEVLHHGVIGKTDLAGDADALRLGLDALKLDAVVELVELDTVEHAEEIEVPVGPAEFAVGRELRPISSCFLMIFSISRSSTSLSCSAAMAPFSRLARASCSGLLRRRLPTWSARNGGLEWAIGIPERVR